MSLTMQSLQEAAHGPEHDYRIGSPHLRHWGLYDRLVSVLRDEIRRTAAEDLPLTLLEVGAGHGGYTEPALAFGCAVTATEMSRASLARLRSRYHLNPHFDAVFDADGSLSVLDGQRFSLVLCASVVHHIPDYLSFLETCVSKHLTPSGSLITVQDPLWYPSMFRADLFLTKLGYFTWRLTTSNYIEGARTQARRLRKVLDEQNPSDMVEYHVVRKGVDHEQILEYLTPRFEKVSMIPYWSSQSPVWQRVGEHLQRTNTFSVVARGLRG